MPDIICDLCFHHCVLKENGTGFCHVRRNENGRNVLISHGRITSLALDPIEKKPLAMYYPGSRILSVGSYGCNLACPFCQNHEISLDENAGYYSRVLSPEDLAELALETEDNLGGAFTYNEPLISWEYILDTAALIRPKGKKTVLVSNGCAEEKIIRKIQPYIDAANIDLKGDRAFYRELSGSYDQAKRTIELLSRSAHVEITILVIPGKNDRKEWIEEESRWIASLNPEIPLHLTRYFPRYRYTIPETPPETILELKKTAGQYLRHVFAGNMHAFYRRRK